MAAEAANAYADVHPKSSREGCDIAGLGIMMNSVPFDKVRYVMRWIMASFYIVAGIFHLTRPDAFLPIVPNEVPFPVGVVLVTGICEIAGGLALMTERMRWLAGVMLTLYAVCVFPANIKHAIDGIDLPPVPNSWWYHGPRLALQPVLVWWALFSSRVIDWPFGKVPGQA